MPIRTARRWALCFFCNGNGCRHCDWRGEHTNEYDRKP